MPVYIVTGKLGAGKSLVTVGRIKDYLLRGRPVATNLNIYLDKMFHKEAKNCRVIRVPDKPTIFDLSVIGSGNDTYDEENNGVLVLDECGTWFNARNWNDKSRGPVNDWFLHARKLGWDVYLLVQDVSILDSQARVAIAEHTVFCRRLDRIAVPYIGGIIKLLTGVRVKGPKIHSARIVYGTSETDMFVDRWVYRGRDLYRAYDTKQKFLDDYPHGAHSLLTPWHLLGRYRKPWTTERLMRITKIHLKRFHTPLALAAAAFLGVVVSMFALPFAQAALQQRAAMVEQLAAVPALVAPEPVQAKAAGELPPQRLSPIGITGPSSPEPQLLKDKFQGFTIAAYVGDESNFYYLLRGRDGGTFTDSQLRSMGLRVYPVNECELLLVDAVELEDSVQVFLPGCSPRDKRPRRDLLSESDYFAKIPPMRF